MSDDPLTVALEEAQKELADVQRLCMHDTEMMKIASSDIKKLKATIQDLRSAIATLPCYLQHTTDQWRLCAACKLKKSIAL